MIKDPDELQIGRIVYLYPQNKQASANVHRMLTVTVLKDPARHWPMVVVGWKEGNVEKWELVHRDNIRLRSPAARNRKEEKEGDTARDTGGMSKWSKVRVMPGKAKAAPMDGQETLF